MISGTSEHCPIISTATNCTYCPANNCPASSGQLIPRFEAPLLSIQLTFCRRMSSNQNLTLYRAESKRNDFKIFTIGNGTYPLFLKVTCHLLDTICPQRLSEFGVVALFLTAWNYTFRELRIKYIYFSPK